MGLLGWRRGKKGMVGIEVRPTSLSIAVANAADQIALVDAIEVMPAKRAEALRQFVDRHKLEGMCCNLILPPELYSLQQVEKPPVEEHEMLEAVRWKVKDMLEFDLQDAVLDVFSFPEDALRGRPAQVNVVSIRKTVIAELIQVVKESHLELQSIDITELALRNLVQPLAAEGSATALIVMRESSGIMLLVKDSSVYFSRRLEADMQNMEDPEQEGRIGQQLALEVQRSMDYFERQMGQKAPREVLASSEIFEAELLTHLGDILGLDIKTIPEDKIGIAEDQFVNAQHWVAVGGAMRKELTGGKKAA